MRYFWVVLALFYVTSPLKGEPLNLSIGAEGAILINAKTGAILYAKNPHKPAFPASTTKIATALYTLKEKNNLEEKVIVKKEAVASITPQAKIQSNYRSPPHWLETDGSHIGIKKGEEFCLRDLLYAMLVPSANDASNVIAEHVGGTIPTFMEGVNLYLKQLGCRNTHFNNPHGLHHPEHVTTPYDMAILTREVLKSSIFREIVSTVNYTCPQTNLEYERPLRQTNRLLKNGSDYYPKAIGVKTGTTQAAGKNLVAAAEQDGRLLIAVFFGYKARNTLYQDAIKLFEAAFNQPKMRRYLLSKGAQSLTAKVSGSSKKLKTYLPDGLYYDFYPAEDLPVKAHVSWNLPSLPISKGQQVGLIKVADNAGNIYRQTPIYALETLNGSLWHRFKEFLVSGKRGRQIVFWMAMGVSLFFIRKMRQKFKRRKRKSRNSY